MITAISQNRANEPATQGFQPDEATALCLAALTNNETILEPAGFLALKARNDALLNSPKTEIKSALCRQAVVLEAASLRYLARSATARNDTHAAILSKIGLSASKSLLGVLAALNSLANEEPPELGVVFDDDD